MPNMIVALAWAFQLGLQAAPSGDRMYGRVLTADGERLEGYLRWDRNETHWADVLDGEKTIPVEYDREAERLDPELRRRRELERRIDLPGLRITWDEDDGDPRMVAAGVRFGHLRSIEVLDERRALLVLLSGEELELRGMNSDLGRTFRGLVVDDRERGEVELRWRDLDRVELMAPPTGAPAPSAERLHGTALTRAGVELTGYVAWDMDETLSTDVLEGREGRSDREIELGSVAALRPEGSRATRVTLRSGEELVLTGTNDVNEGNRGLEVSDPALGRVIVPWGALESLVFVPAPAAGTGGSAGQGSRSAFDGGRALSGTVETSLGQTLTGRIRWDNDEESSWEFLDGRSDGVNYDVELSRVRSIERTGASSARVELLDGRSLHLEDSNDVDERNQGIFVRVEGRGTVLVPWSELERLTLAP